MKKNDDTKVSKSQPVRLTNTPERKEANRKAKERHKEAAKRAGFRVVTPTNFKAVSEYFEYAQHVDTELLTALQVTAKATGVCQWCATLEEQGLLHCLHCGKFFGADT